MREIVDFEYGDETGGNLRRGVMVVKNNIVVEKIKLSEGIEEVMDMQISMKGGKKRHFAMPQVPPKTRAWNEMNYQKMLGGTFGFLQRVIIESENKILLGNFNYKEVH